MLYYSHSSDCMPEASHMRKKHLTTKKRGDADRGGRRVRVTVRAYSSLAYGDDGREEQEA